MYQTKILKKLTGSPKKENLIYHGVGLMHFSNQVENDLKNCNPKTALFEIYYFFLFFFVVNILDHLVKFKNLQFRKLDSCLGQSIRNI